MACLADAAFRGHLTAVNLGAVRGANAISANSDMA